MRTYSGASGALIHEYTTPAAPTEAVLQAWFPSSFGFSGLLVTNGLRLRLGF